MKALVVPILTIALGVGWLLTTVNVLPGVNWVWVVGLGASGLLLLALSGVDRVSLVIGPLLIIASIFSLLRQTGRISPDVEVPCLVIAIGVLMLLARVLRLPEPRWWTKPPQ